jgi:hypothetical protein
LKRRPRIGPRNERLVHFKVAPLRKRTRKPELAVKKQPVETAPAKPVA